MGTMTAGFESRPLFNNHRPCFQLFSHLLLNCLQARKSCDLPPPPFELWIRYITETPSILKAVSKAAKLRTNVPEASKTQHRSSPISKQIVLRKVCVCNACNTKTLVSGSPKHPNFELEICTTSDPETNPRQK